jgi:Stigma-specific protein, Stig1
MRKLGDTSLDAVARGLASGMSRRDALRAGGAAFFAAAAMTPTDAWAAVTGRCPSHRVKCHGTCCPKGEVCLAPKHKGGKRRCGCPDHKTRCGNTCVNLTSDRNHCGHCGEKCPSGHTCVHGKCTGPTEPGGCASGEAMGAGTCVTLASDPANCGACGDACAAGQVCVSGQCTT